MSILCLSPLPVALAWSLPRNRPTWSHDRPFDTNRPVWRRLTFALYHMPTLQYSHIPIRQNRTQTIIEMPSYVALHSPSHTTSSPTTTTTTPPVTMMKQPVAWLCPTFFFFPYHDTTVKPFYMCYPFIITMWRVVCRPSCCMRIQYIIIWWWKQFALSGIVLSVVSASISSMSWCHRWWCQHSRLTRLIQSGTLTHCI